VRLQIAFEQRTRLVAPRAKHRRPNALNQIQGGFDVNRTHRTSAYARGCASALVASYRVAATALFIASYFFPRPDMPQATQIRGALVGVIYRGLIGAHLPLSLQVQSASRSC
jgi:hypothetical protein